MGLGKWLTKTHVRQVAQYDVIEAALVIGGPYQETMSWLLTVILHHTANIVPRCNNGAALILRRRWLCSTFVSSALTLRVKGTAGHWSGSLYVSVPNMLN